ncbi:LacI family DNA-binding transcriptional regulator [Cerasicoccus arenae]|nr:LacI family DNA-binding transcriptional regulator [Cerasicoccus arenae]MBK1858596.1 LacI family DNA-binding transcriptional regulator [Cerasicoccus arenae]
MPAKTNSSDQSVSMQEIADRCSVVQATVSNVLRNRPNGRVGDETREKIFRAAIELRYKMRSDQRIDSRKRQIGYLLLDLDFAYRDSFYSGSLVRQIKMIEESFDFNVQIYTYPRDQFDRMLYKAVCGDYCDALVLSRYGGEELVNELVERLPIPLVYLDDSHGLKCSSLSPNMDAMGRIAAEHLYQKGYRKFAVFGGYLSDYRGMRGLGFVNFLKELGIPSKDIIIYDEEYGFNGGRMMALQLIKQLTREPVGVFSHDDDVGFSALQAFQEQRISVPNQVGIIGCNNAVHSPYTYPPLSSIDLMANDHAQTLLRMLTNSMKENRIDTIRTPLKLIPRGSTMLTPD